jgi:predicted AlkP superfamily phosphohydrolase/phosphomutase
VDWSTTCVYWGADNGLTINLKGRQPEGIVEPAEYGALCDELIARWRDLRCPENGDPVVEAIYRREDIFSGPHAADSPDLLVVWKSDSDRRTTYFSAGELWADAMFSSAGPTGAHVPVGVLIAGGRHIVPGGSIEGAHIMDIAPTVLHALSQPIPQGMDGKVLDGIFDPALRPAPHAAVDAARSPAPSAEDQGTETTHGVESEPQATYSPDEQKQIEERLRALGYLD